MTDALNLDALEQRLAKLPPGPWRAANQDDFPWIVRADERMLARAYGTTQNEVGLVQSFLADSRAIVEQLLARVRLAEVGEDGLCQDTTTQSVAYRAGFAAGQEDMRERAAKAACDDGTQSAAYDIEDLPIKEAP